VTVQEFDINNGLYIFEFNDLETEFHSHPTVEIIIAKTGYFTLWTKSETYNKLKFAVIKSNEKHKLSCTDGTLQIIMIEYHDIFVFDQIKFAGIDLRKGFFLQSILNKDIVQVEMLVHKIKSGIALNEYDFRISDTIEYLNQHDLEYRSMIKTLLSITNLSESRLSHLFKSSIGISLKKYLIWSKLKSTIKNHLNKKEDLFSSLIKSGFYDHPHFSKSFKCMLGVKPSKAYNSRIVQVKSSRTK